MSHEAGGLNLRKPALNIFCESMTGKMKVMESEGCFSVKLNLFRLGKQRQKAGLRGQYDW